MVIKQSDGIRPKPWTLTLRLSERERRMVDEISADRGYSIAGTIRVVIEEAFERHQENANRTRLENIEEQARKTNTSLAEVLARIEAIFPVVRGEGIEIKEKLGRAKEDLVSKIDELEETTNSTAVRLLAMVNASSSREKIEAETRRILNGE